MLTSVALQVWVVMWFFAYQSSPGPRVKLTFWDICLGSHPCLISAPSSSSFPTHLLISTASRTSFISQQLGNSDNLIEGRQISTLFFFFSNCITEWKLNTIIFCGELMKSWVNFYGWQGHSHIKDPSAQPHGNDKVFLSQAHMNGKTFVWSKFGCLG